MNEPLSSRTTRDNPLLRNHIAVLRIALVLWAAAASLFVLMAVPSTRDAVQSIDDAVRRAAVAAEWGPAVDLAKVLNVLGSGLVTIPIRIAVALWLGFRRRFEALTVWVMAIAISEPALTILKSAYGRARPPGSLVKTTGFSFPSGHAVAGTVIALSLVIVFVRVGAARRNLEILAAVFVFLMALSRVYVRAHWLTDAAAGVALGAAVTLMVAAVAHEVNDRIFARSSGSDPPP